MFRNRDLRFGEIDITLKINDNMVLFVLLSI